MGREKKLYKGYKGGREGELGVNQTRWAVLHQISTKENARV